MLLYVLLLDTLLLNQHIKMQKKKKLTQLKGCIYWIKIQKEQ